MSYDILSTTICACHILNPPRINQIHEYIKLFLKHEENVNLTLF